MLDSSHVFMAHVDSWQEQGRIREAYGGGTAEFAGWRLMASGLRHSYLNAACVTDYALADIDQARAWYRTRNVDWGIVIPSGSAWPHGRLLLRQCLMAVEAATLPKGSRCHRCASSDERGPEMSTSWPLLTPTRSVPTSQMGALWLEPLCLSDRAKVAIGELDGVPVATGYALSCHSEVRTQRLHRRDRCNPFGPPKGYRRRPVELAPGPRFRRGGRVRPSPDRFLGSRRVSMRRLGFEDFRGIDIYDGQ